MPIEELRCLILLHLCSVLDYLLNDLLLRHHITIRLVVVQSCSQRIMGLIYHVLLM